MNNNVNKNMMKTQLALNTLALAILATPLLSMSAQGAGLQLMPGSPNFGTAGAGHTAIGMGAGSAWANPATMVLVEGQQVGFGVIMAQTDIEFEADDSTVDSGGNAGGDIIIPSFAYVNSINEQLSVGFSFVVPFGNSLDYNEGWEGENVANSVSLETLQAMPSIAYRINDQFSVGFGMTANHTSVEQGLKMNMSLEGVPFPVNTDVALEADSLDYGWTLGGLFEMDGQNRIGFVYRSEVNSDLTGTGTLSNSNIASLDGSYDTELSWVNPASIVISGVHQLNDDVSVMWDLGRTFYSAFNETQVLVKGLLPGDPPSDLPLTLERNWKDANRYAVGTHYQLNNKVILQAGYAFEESTVDDADRNVDIPLDEIQRYTVGALYTVTTDTELAFGLEYADLGTPSTESEDNNDFSAPSGEFDNSAVAASFSVNYRF
mgnify:CR=1 FL=1